MSWSALLHWTMPPRFIAGSQTAKSTLCIGRPPTAEITPKILPSSPVNPAAIPCIGLTAIRETFALLTIVDAVSLKSP